MKFGTLIAKDVPKKIGCGAIMNFQHGARGSHVSQWPPAMTVFCVSGAAAVPGGRGPSQVCGPSHWGPSVHLLHYYTIALLHFLHYYTIKLIALLHYYP